MNSPSLRPSSAEAQADALADSRADLRRKVHALQRSIRSGEKRLRQIEDSSVSSSGASASAITFTEDEVEEMEGVMGDLTAQLADVPVRAIMMFMVWDELRARTTLKDKDDRGIGPLGAAVLNDQVWKVGTMLTWCSAS